MDRPSLVKCRTKSRRLSRLQPHMGSMNRGPGPMSLTHPSQRRAERRSSGSLMQLRMGRQASLMSLVVGKSACEDSFKGEDEGASGYAAMREQLSFFWNVISGIDLFVIFLISSLQTLWVNETAWGKICKVVLSHSKVPVGTLGAFYSFALVFRTNICYARWWEGRTLWGTIVVNAIRITQQTHVWIEDESAQERLNCLAIAFAYACKAHLRGHSLRDADGDGPGLVERGVLSQPELEVIHTQNGWQPFYCLDAIRSTLMVGLRKQRNGGGGDAIAAQMALESTIGHLASSIGGCIRVQSTGLPFAYDDILKAIGNIFFLVASLSWAPDLQFYNPFLVLTIYCVVKMINGVGNFMEDPFGLDVSDLPLEKYCATVERQINSIEERLDLITYDLGYGPEDGPMIGNDIEKLIVSASKEFGQNCEKAVDYDIEANQVDGIGNGTERSSAYRSRVPFAFANDEIRNGTERTSSLTYASSSEDECDSPPLLSYQTFRN